MKKKHDIKFTWGWKPCGLRGSFTILPSIHWNSIFPRGRNYMGYRFLTVYFLTMEFTWEFHSSIRNPFKLSKGGNNG